MLRKVASKVAWVGRTASMVFGLALVLALLFGAASMALAKNGDPWLLGRSNVATAITSLGGALGVNGPMLQLINNNAGANDTALDLRVQAGEPPMRVNRATKVANLNADRLDGLDSTEIGVNGVETAVTESASNSDSYKVATATCPEGKIAVGSGYVLIGGKRGTFPNLQTDVVITYIFSEFDYAQVAAYEEEPTSDNWSVRALARCAKEGT